MTLSQNLLYLLLLYAVLDKCNTLSLTTALIIAFGIMLLTCYKNNLCCGNNNFFNTSSNGFSSVNNI